MFFLLSSVLLNFIIFPQFLYSGNFIRFWNHLIYSFQPMIWTQYLIDVIVSRSSRIPSHVLNFWKNVSSSSISSSWDSYIVNASHIVSSFLRKDSFHNSFSSLFANLTDFLEKTFSAWVMYSNMFLDILRIPDLLIHTCSSLYLIHVWITDCGVISSSVSFSTRILFWSRMLNIT